MSYLRYMCLFTDSGVQHILCFVFLRRVANFHGLSIFDCPSVFSNAYLSIKHHIGN